MMTPASPSQTIALAQNRVLRNTYALLALSLVPTVLGAWIGVQMNFSFFQGSPAIGFIAFLAIAFGFMFAIEKTKNSALGRGGPARLHVLHGPHALAHAGRGAGLQERREPSSAWPAAARR